MGVAYPLTATRVGHTCVPEETVNPLAALCHPKIQETQLMLRASSN